MTTYKKRDNNPAENRGEQLQEFLRNNVIMNNLQRNTLSQLALGAVEKTDMKAVGLLLGLPPELTVLLSVAKPLFKGAAQTAVLKMYDDICQRQISLIETAKVDYAFKKAEKVFWEFVEKEGEEAAGYSFDAFSPEYEGARQAAEGFLMQSMKEFEHKKLDVLGSYYGRNMYYGNTQWERIYQTQKMIDRLSYRQIVLIRLISEHFKGEDPEHCITAPDACVEVMELLNYGIWKAPGAFLNQDNSQPIKLKSLVATPHADKLNVELMLDKIEEADIKHIKATLRIWPSENVNETLTLEDVTDMKDSMTWEEAQDSDVDEIFDRVQKLEDNQLSVEYDANEEKLSLKKGK